MEVVFQSDNGRSLKVRQRDSDGVRARPGLILHVRLSHPTNFNSWHYPQRIGVEFFESSRRLLTFRVHVDNALEMCRPLHEVMSSDMLLVCPPGASGLLMEQ
jgi:hypothetical protein